MQKHCNNISTTFLICSYGRQRQLGGQPPRARKPLPQSSALRLCRPPHALRPFHSALLRYKGGETPQLALATPRLRQVAFGMYVTCHCHNNGNGNHREEAPMSKKAAAATKPSVYQIVTDRITASLKAGVIPWEKPWQTPHFAGGPFPRNFRTGKPYRGINIMLLWSCSYGSPFWLTFNQAKELSGSVRKGEKGTQIVFYKQLRDGQKTDDERTAEVERRAPFVLTYHTVFNVEQCDGLTLPQIEPPPQTNEVEVDETCEAIVSGWTNRPSLQLTSETEYRAYYRPSTDSVHVPARARFVDAPHYYSTLFHELIHSTGHESRLNRAFGTRFGDDLYSKEELVAEMGAAFLCAIAGIANENTERNTTAYIQNWISKLEEDNRLVVHAASNAQRAVDSILGASLMNTDESEEQTKDATITDISHPDALAA
jgi:antirestriction protein ArdC